MGKKRGKGIYTYSSGERYEGEMGGNKGYKHGQVEPPLELDTTTHRSHEPTDTTSPFVPSPL